MTPVRLSSPGSRPTAGTGLAGTQEKTVVAFSPTDGFSLKNQVLVHVCTAWDRRFLRRSCKGCSENFLNVYKNQESFNRHLQGMKQKLQLKTIFLTFS